MTTIAYDGTSVSVDSLVTSDGFKEGHYRKWRKLPNGDYVFGAGNWEDVARIFEAMLAEEEPDEDLWESAIIVTLDTMGRVWEQYNSPRRERRRAVWAYGSGREFALGALEAGATSAQAVAIAKKYNTGTGGPVKTVHAKRLAKEKKPTAAQRVYPNEVVENDNYGSLLSDVFRGEPGFTVVKY